MKVFLVTPECNNWIPFYPQIELVETAEEADFIFFEKYANPINEINHLREIYPKNKLVFILSGDDSNHLDDECIWFTSATQGTALKKYQTQIPCINPCAFKYPYDRVEKTGDIYFKGSIWPFRQAFYDYFSGKSDCRIERFDHYWQTIGDGSNADDFIKRSAFAMYDEMKKYKISLCPKGFGSSSMRIVESLRCECIPVLIDDFSAPYGIDWKTMGLVFDTSKQSWDDIYQEIQNLLVNENRLNELREAGQKAFHEILAFDLQNGPCETFKTIIWGSSHMLVKQLESYLNSS